ncbi:Clp protease N-terminal domain-containing protein [Actinophytocola xanthii]|uniref:Peptidase n=1 Tax=Actinophytocola xanthii TaxID=1912961 RepID=A0A1Q8CUB9_9PSEU|nr:Clp protease N-terminal domain-containing protein [Actinophytocola xanthii]OLF17957.1 peptidase [Actinophytocola xanthii]
MPKVNVYLPDELADNVREMGLPVSAICQRALEQSVKRVGAIRAAAVGDLSGPDATAALTLFTQRAKDVIMLAVRRAHERGAAEIGSRDLLHGMISEGGNLALHVLRSIEVDPAQVLREVERLETGDPGGPAVRMSRAAAHALELTVVEAIVLGHNYVGCEHLLLGLVAEPEGSAGAVLRRLGVDTKTARQAVAAALAGYLHLQANQANQANQAAGATSVAAAVNTAVTQALQPVLTRLDRLEERAGLTGGDS